MNNGLEDNGVSQSLTRNPESVEIHHHFSF
jgi:hypothetical protein